MRVTEIKYQRVKNLGNYETERVEMVAELNDDDQIDDVMLFLKTEVNRVLGLVDGTSY